MFIPTKERIVDSNGNVIEIFTRPLDAYVIADKDETIGGTSYYGYVDATGNWYIQKETTTSTTFISGTSNYTTNWTNRAALSYDTFNNVF